MNTRPTLGGGFDFVLLGAVDVRDGKDQACFPIGPCLDGSRAQSPGGLRRQHAHADVFDDIPDALAATLLAHVDAPFVSRLPACEAPLQSLSGPLASQPRNQLRAVGVPTAADF